MAYNELGYNTYLQQNTIPVPTVGGPDSIEMADMVDGRIADYIPGARTYDAVCSQDSSGDYRGNDSIQKALDDGHKKILVRNGDYEVNENIAIDNSNVSIEGESRSGVTISHKMSGGGYYVFEIGGKVTASIDSLYNISVSNLTIEDSGVVGILSEYTIGLNIHNCDLRLLSSGIQILANNKDVRISNNYFYRLTGVNVYAPYSLLGLVVIDNTMAGLTSNTSAIVQLGGSVSGAIISRNRMIAQEYGIFSEAFYTRIVNNYISSSGHTAIVIYQGSSSILTGNVIDYCEKSAVAISTSDKCIVSNNIIKDSGGLTNDTYWDIYIGTSNKTVVSGNNCVSTGTNKVKYNIEETGTSNYNIITSNFTEGAVTDNILTTGANTIEANNIEI